MSDWNDNEAVAARVQYGEHDFAPVKPLQERMMLVRKRTKRQRRSIPDKNARAALAASTGTDERTWNVSKKMFTKSKLFKAMNTAINAAEAFIEQHTTAHLDDGFRMLPSVEFMTFTQGLKPFIENVETTAAAFCANFENEVVNDMRWNAQFSRDDYPYSPPQISVSVDFRPIASGDAFYQDVDAATRREYEDMLDAAEQAGKDDVVKRLLEPLQQTVERLDVYKGDKKQRWHQDVVDNAYDMLDTLEGLVTDGDATIMQLIADTRATLAPFYDNDKLKTSQLARDTAKLGMEHILSKFQ